MIIGPILDLKNYEFSILGLPRAIIAVFGLLVPLLLYFKNRRSTVHQLYVFAIIPAFLWQFGYAWMMQAKNPEVALFWSGVGQIGSYLLPSVIYGFSVFQTRSYKQWPLLALSFACSFTLCLLIYHPLLMSGLKHYSWGYYNLHGPLHRWVLLFLGVTAAGFFINLIRDYRNAQTLRRKKLDWFFLVAFGCAYLGAFEYLPGYGYDVRPVGFLAVSIWSLLILWGSYHYRTADLETLIAQTFSYFLVSLLAFLVAVGFTAAAQMILVGVISWSEIFVTSLALLAIFPMANFAYRKIQRRLSKSLHQQRLHGHETLLEFNEELKELTNCKLLLHELVSTLRATIGVEKTAVYLKTPNVDAYLLQESSGEESRELALPARHEIILWLKESQEIVDRNQLLELPWRSSLRSKGIQLLDEMGYDLLIPLILGSDLLGFLALGKRFNRRPFDVSDIQLLQVVGKNAAVAISNALLFAELSEKNQTLIRLEREKAHFLANASHELRTPLHGILGIADILLEGQSGEQPLDKNQKHYLKLIHDSGKALADLVDKLLHIERMDARKSDCEITGFKLKDVVDMVAPIIEGVLKDKKAVELKIQIPQNLEVYGDLSLIRQVLMNLLGNSAKFTAKGSIELSAWKGNGIRGERQSTAEDAERYITVCVSDTGIGIRPEDQALIFQPFQQADASIKNTFGGSGLGLAIVRKIVELHQGRIWVESQLGQGCHFYFTLPQFAFSMQEAEKATHHSMPFSTGDHLPILVASDRAEHHPLTSDRLYSVSKPSLSNHRKGKGERILVIDDNEGNARLTCSRLEVAGYAPHFASNAEEAWKSLSEQPSDLIVLDVMMPGVDGFEFCQRLRRFDNYKRIPVIMVTAKATLEDKVYGLNVGADDYLSKPFNAEELVARVNTLLRIKRINDDLMQKNRELKTISEITSVINKEIELDRLLLVILDKMIELVGADRGCLFTFEDDSQEMTLRFSRGFASQKRTDVIKAISHDLIQSIPAAANQIVVIPDIAAQTDRVLLEKSGSLICLPLSMRDKFFGCLYLYAAQSQKLQESLLRFLMPISQQMSNSIYNARLYDLAITDDLTRLYLKRHFFEVLKAECDRAQTQGQKFSLIMIDIDHFKLFNDSYGHPLGDSVLVQVAELLQDSCRMTDIAARYGGEEFIVLLRNTELREAAAFAERYRKLVESFRIHHRGKALHVTVSAGVCGFQNLLHISPEAMIAHVDFELYRAKAAGRNCISIRELRATVLENPAQVPVIPDLSGPKTPVSFVK